MDGFIGGWNKTGAKGTIEVRGSVTLEDVTPKDESQPVRLASASASVTPTVNDEVITIRLTSVNKGNATLWSDPKADLEKNVQGGGTKIKDKITDDVRAELKNVSAQNKPLEKAVGGAQVDVAPGYYERIDVTLITHFDSGSFVDKDE